VLDATSSAFVGAPARITATFPDRDPIRSGEHILVDTECGSLQLSAQLGEAEFDLVSRS
jgi:hypothetical protein